MAPKTSGIFVIEHPKELVKQDPEKIEDGEKEYSFEDALDLIGFGKIQIVILLVSGIILMAVINETMGMMIISIASQCDLNLTAQEKGFLGAVSFIGIMISSHLWGYVADTAGRRKLIMYTLFGSNIFSVVSCFTNNYWVFVTIRLLAGISISGPSATLYAYLGEFNTFKYRPVTISWASAFVGVATVYIPGIAWLILPGTWSIPIYNELEFRPWRLLLILYTLPGFIGALCLYKLPESPKFLLSQGKDDKAMDILHWIYENNTGKSFATYEVKKLVPEVDKEYLENVVTKKKCLDIVKSMWKQTVPLFKPPHLLNFTICSVVQFGLFFCSGGMGLWYPEIQNRLNSMPGAHMTVCEVVHLNSNKSQVNDTNYFEKTCDDSISSKVYVDSMMLGVFYIVGYVILALIINPVGRKIILAAALFGSGFAGISLHWINEPLAIVLLFCSFLMLAGLCISVVNGAVVDLIPTHLRGMAVCISLMLGRLGSVAGSNIIGNLLEVNCSLTFMLFSGFITVCALLTLILPSNKK